MERRNGHRNRKRKDREEESAGITPFNMEDENEEGHFDDKGNFVWNAEDKKVQEEAWLEDVSEEQIGAALQAKSRKDYRDDQATETMTEEQANRTLAKLLRSRETVLQALQRLGSKRKPKRAIPKRKQSKATDNGTVEQTAEEKAQFEQITEAADYLMRIGEVDVYSQMKEEFISEEELLTQRSREREQQEEKQESKSEENPPKQEVMWEYKDVNGQIHGPFPTSAFIAWQQQGYFKGDSTADMRPVIDSSTQKTDKPTENSKKEEVEPEKISAEQELLNDFEDSEDEDESADNKAEKEKENEWKRSDLIDFSLY